MPIANRECFKVNLRDRLACRRCGKRPGQQAAYHRGFEYHHHTHRSAGGADVAENLILACRRCHRRHHAGEIDLTAIIPGPVPPTLDCHACGTPLDSNGVEMNCGWYQCQACRTRTHLYSHCGYAADET